MGEADEAPWLPATHSIPSTVALAALLAERYGLGEPTVRFLRPSLNDVFDVSSDAGHFALRLYRTGWRTDEDIRWEVDLLRRLHATGVAVHRPVPTVDGEPFTAVRAAEGRRQLLLFDFLEGRLTRGGTAKGSKPSVAGLAEEYGALAGGIHAVGDELDSSHQRFPLDVEHLLLRPLQATAPLLAHRPRDLARLTEQVVRMVDRITAVEPRLDWGPCHGDLTGENAVLGDDGTLTMFDFDCGGPGWRAYDLGVFAWSMTLHGHDEEVLHRFRRGYERVRELKDDDWRQLPLFRAVRQVWFIGMQSENSPDWGYSKADDDFFDRQLHLLGRLLADVD